MDTALAVELPDDIEALKTLLLEQQILVDQKEAELRHERTQQAKRDELIAARDVKIGLLEQRINLLLAQRYGASAETVSQAQLKLFNEAEAEALEDEDEPQKTEVGPHRRRRPKRSTLPAELPRVDIEHPLPEDQRLCPHHGVELERFSQEISEQLDIVPAKIQVLRHIRGTYRCPCCSGHIVTAPMTPQPIPKSMASPGLLAHIAVAKFVDGLPLYRQHQQLLRIGFELSRTTMAMWMVRLGQLVQPLINLLRETMLAEDYLLMDETTVQVLKESGKSPQSKSYLWAQGSTSYRWVPRL
jgi:transposase